MNKILYIINEGPTLKIGFTFAMDAIDFIERQSTDPTWRAQWTLRFLSNRNVCIETNERVVLHFN